MSSDGKKESPLLSHVSLESLLAVRMPTESVATSANDNSRGWVCEWAEGLPPFRAGATCSACGYHSASTKFERFSSPDEERKVVVLVERHVRECDRCSNKWFEGLA